MTSAEFCPHYSATLVTISEDRTFKVYFKFEKKNGNNDKETKKKSRTFSFNAYRGEPETV